MAPVVPSFVFLLLLPLLLLLLCADWTSASIFAPYRFPLPSNYDAAFPKLRLSDFERAALTKCPCGDVSLCLPLAFSGGSNAQLSATTKKQKGKKGKKEVYAFSVTTTDEWKRYDWEQVRCE